MRRFNGVTTDGDDSAYSRHRSTSASIPSIQLSASTVDDVASKRIDSSKLRPMIGNITLNTKLPEAPAHSIVESLPITCAATMRVASGSTGFTFPGMMLDPGCKSGKRISARPVRGPELIHRKSLHNFVRLTAIV